VDGQNYLGIYIGKDGATVVCLGAQGRAVKGCFSVSLDEQRERNTAADMSELARLIADGCAQRDLTFAEAAVALDCSMFMQHAVHSEFSDARQISQTVRFDTEEALSTDISDVAIAFEISSTDETGSDLTVFTARREILSPILLSLQSHNIDPITLEPDVNCLSRFILENTPAPEDTDCLFAALSQTRGYFIGCTKSRQTPAKRTFLIHATQKRTDLLARQVPLTAALMAKDDRVGTLKVFDSARSVDCHRLGDKLGIDAAEFDLLGSLATEPDALSECTDAVEFTVAAGAALAHVVKGRAVNFRDDFMPFQGKKLRLQKTLKFLSISVTILLIALGTHVTALLLQMNQYRSRLLNDRFEPEYSAVMGGRPLRGGVKTGVRSLGSEFRRTRDIIGSGGSQQSVLGKLMLILEALNKSTKGTRLSVDTVSIAENSISVTGSTSNRGNTLKLRNALTETNLGPVLVTFDPEKSGPDNFKFTIKPQR
jgi:hypothetical protein